MKFLTLNEFKASEKPPEIAPSRLAHLLHGCMRNYAGCWRDGLEDRGPQPLLSGMVPQDAAQFLLLHMACSTPSSPSGWTLKVMWLTLDARLPTG
jgi:hypothetical protein